MDKIVENRLRFLRRILDFIHNNFNTREKNIGLLLYVPSKLLRIVSTNINALSS